MNNRCDLRKDPAYVLGRVYRRVAVPWHTRTPPMALAQVSAGSTRRHTGRTRPTGVCGDHVGGPGTYARTQ